MSQYLKIISQTLQSTNTQTPDLVVNPATVIKRLCGLEDWSLGDTNAQGEGGGRLWAASVSVCCRAEEKPGLQIHEDQVLCLFFFTRRRGQICSGLSRWTTDDPGPQITVAQLCIG